MKKKIVLFASGNGSNVERICEYFKDNNTVIIDSVFTNNPKAKVLERIIPYNVSGFSFTKEAFTSGALLDTLKNSNPDLIVLAGFLWKIPTEMVDCFPKRIINIHPALLPKYGGKGMYGHFVHEAVVSNQENETGITIHYVNEKYDDGAIIFQKAVTISSTDTPSSVAQKVHQLEHAYFPTVIEQLLTNEVINEK